MTDQEKHKELRRKIMRYGAIAGLVLGMICNSLPHDYQSPCNAVAQIFSLTCGGN